MPTIYKPTKIKKRRKTETRAERMEIYATRRWRNLRRLKMISNPICEECLKVGKVTPTEDVHHIISFMSVKDPYERRKLAYDYDNLESLCRACHNKKHRQGLSNTKIG